MDDLYAFDRQESSDLLKMRDAWRRGSMAQPAPAVVEDPIRPDIVPFIFVQSGETLPAYGIAEVYGVETAGQRRLLVRRPTGDDYPWYIVNGGVAIAHNAKGWGAWGTCEHVLALYDDGDTPAYGKEWGPQPTSYKLKRGRTGFIVQGTGTGGSTDLVSVIQQGKQGIYFGTNSDSLVLKGSNATVTMKNTSGTSFGFTRSVKCRLATLEDSYDCHVSYIDGVWELVGKECEA